MADGAAGGAARRSSPGGGRGRRGRGGRIGFLLALLTSSLVLLVATVGAVWVRLEGGIATFDAGGFSKDRPPADLGGQNILLLGSDSRSGANSGLAGGTGAVGRSDTAILLHVYADDRHALGVSIPRDSLVTIPPCLLPDGSWSPTRYQVPFNSAFSTGDTPKGNPACAQNTVERLTGLRVDHTIVVDFAGFAAMTDAVHGVPVCVPQDVYQGDINPNLGRRGALVFHRGLQTLSGGRALDYVRLRHGIGDGSDIGRTQRQQAFVAAMIKKVRAEGFNVTSLLPLANAATRSLTVDPGLDSAGKLVSFAMSLKGISLADIQFITAPWRYAGEKIALRHPEVDTVWAAMRADRPLSGTGAHPSAASGTPASSTPTGSAGSGRVDGSGVAVGVYNGTTVPGLAARVAESMRADGFAITGTATAAEQDVAVTEIRYGTGHLADARTVARLFPGARLVPSAVLGVDLVLGTDAANAGGVTEPGAADRSGTPAGAAVPSELPGTVAGTARTADEDPCADLTYGSGG